jgi:hypothetical protein
MSDIAGHQLLADGILVLHIAFVAFVAGGLALIIAGNLLGWRWVNGFRFRLCHLAAIGFVVAQAWLGAICPLTRLEMWLREQARQGAYSGSFIEYWLQRLLYFEAPAWVFVMVYTLFGLAVVATWRLYPPRRGDKEPP